MTRPVVPRARTRSRPITAAPSPLGEALPGTDLRDLQLSIVYTPIASLTRAPRTLRRRAKGQVERIAASIRAHGCVLPLLATAGGELIAGEGVLEALIHLGCTRAPVIVIDHLPPGRVRTLRIALNKLAEESHWDPGALAAELEELLQIDPDLLAATSFTMPEADLLLAQLNVELGLAPEDDEAPEVDPGPVVSRLGDLWESPAGHKLLCGNARDPGSYPPLLGAERVQMMATDPPYGCGIAGHVSRSHGEFVEGSGMSEAEAETFFTEFLHACTGHLADGAIVDLFIDWRGMYPLLTALRGVGLVQKCLITWDKGAAGMGSLYRQQAEFVIVAKWGRAPHINNISLGRYGRNRTTVWQAPGLAQFGRGRQETLRLHPTVKPLGLIADMLLDTSQIGGVVLDPFCGSGTTLLAAHRTRRLGRGIELDPRYVDVAVRRLEAATGDPVRLAGSTLTFAEVARARAAAGEPGEPPGRGAAPRRVRGGRDAL